MEYVSSFERVGFKIGLRKGLLICAPICFRAKFGNRGRRLLIKAQALDLDRLEKFMRFLSRAKTLDQVRKYLNRRPTSH